MGDRILEGILPRPEGLGIRTFCRHHQEAFEVDSTTQFTLARLVNLVDRLIVVNKLAECFRRPRACA